MKASHLDYKLSLRLARVIDLIASEAKYHSKCFSTFKRSTSKTKESPSVDIAMIWLCQELHYSADKGHVILLDDVWDRYTELSEESSIIIKSSYLSKRTTFMDNLKSQLGDLFNFFQPLDRCISERKTLLIPTNFNSPAILKSEETQESEENILFPKYEPDEDIFLSLVHVALKVHGDIKETLGHKDFLLTKQML